MDDFDKWPCSCGNASSHKTSRGTNMWSFECCECFVKAGNAPADWHPLCVSTHEAIMRGEKVVAVYRVTFDDMENQIGNAVNERCLGVFVGPDPQSRANRFCEARMATEKPYVGWDRVRYPTYVTRTLDVLEAEKVSQ